MNDQVSDSAQPVETLATKFSQASLQLSTDPPQSACTRAPAIKTTEHQLELHAEPPIAVASSSASPPAATASKAKVSRTVKFKLEVLHWAEHGQVDDGRGGKRKPTREEVRVRFGLKQKNQVNKWKKVCSKTTPPL